MKMLIAAIAGAAIGFVVLVQGLHYSANEALPWAAGAAVLAALVGAVPDRRNQ